MVETVGATVTLPEAAPRSSGQEDTQSGLTLPNAQPSAELSQQLLTATSTSQSPHVILAQVSPGDAPLRGTLGPEALEEIPDGSERPPVLSPGEGPSLTTPDTPTTSKPGTPQQFQFTLKQIQLLDRVRTQLGTGNYGRSFESVPLQFVTRTDYTQDEINGLGNSLHGMVSGMLIAANQQAQRIDEYTPAGGARFTVDQLHDGGIGAIRQALREAGIPTEPLYVGIRRPQDSAAASAAAAAPTSATGSPHATAASPAVADPNSPPQAVTAPAVTTTPAAEQRPQAAPALQIVPPSNGATEGQTTGSGTAEDQPVAPTIPGPNVAAFAEYQRRRQLLESEKGNVA
jgi:hypothetical protein